MSQVTMNAYDADVFIPEFKGLRQYGEELGGDLRYSPEAMNVETPGGVLQPSINIDGVELKTSENDFLTCTNGTLMYLRDKYRVSSGLAPYTVFAGNTSIVDASGFSRIPFDIDRNLYFIAANRKIFFLPIAGDPKETGNYVLRECQVVDENDNAVTLNSTNRWSWCTYEYTPPVGPGQVGGDTRNVLLLSNPHDGLFMIDPGNATTLTGTPKVKRIQTPVNFSWIEVYADRVWGVGTGRYEDDTVYYSRAFDCTNWTADNATPENGGGEIREPSWEKDRFVGIKAFADCCVFFTNKRAWRLTGSNPTNFSIQEQYGNGCKWPDTIVDMGKYLMMLGEDSLVTYDGYSVTPFMKDSTYDILRAIGVDDDVKPFATRVGDKYVLTLSQEIGTNLRDTYAQEFEKVSSGLSAILGVTGTTQQLTQARKYYNIVYDMVDGTVLCTEVPQVVSTCRTMPYMLTWTPASGENPGKAKICPIRFDSWENQSVSPNAVRWVSPWITFGRNDIKKGGFEVYFTPEVRKKKVFGSQWWPAENVNGGEKPSMNLYTEAEGNVTLKLTIQTEKKAKTKSYTVVPLTAEEITAGKQFKSKKLHFGGSGRRFRLIIECDAGNTIPWRLIGGVHIIAETDKD